MGKALESEHRVLQAEGSSPGGETYQAFFNFSFVSLIDFSNIAMLRSGPNSCYQQNLKCFHIPLLSLGLFS